MIKLLHIQSQNQVQFSNSVKSPKIHVLIKQVLEG